MTLDAFAPIAPEWTRSAVHVHDFCCPKCGSTSREAQRVWLNRRSPVYTEDYRKMWQEFYQCHCGCAWWAFNRVADLSAQKWGHMRKDVDAVRIKFEEELFQNQKETEEKALAIYKKSPKKARKFLTQYSNQWMNTLVKAYWKLGDDLWTKYTGKF